MGQLRIPGPTPCPPQVLEAMSRAMIDHRGPEFAKIFKRVTEKLKQAFMTRNDLLVLTGSGTGGLEAAVVNVLSPGDKVLGVSIGVFGDRFARIATAFGANVIPLKAPLGKAIEPEAVRQALQDNPDVKAVLITHNETSTGVTNDLAAISPVVKGAGKLLVVDSISGSGAIPCLVDDWKLDVVVGGSQKGWMVPPGLTMLSVSADAWKAHAAAKMPRTYWDFTEAKKYVDRGQTPWTPAVSMVYAFDVALDMILSQGMPAVFAKHQRIGDATRRGVKSIGLSVFADEKHASNTVTAVTVPPGTDVKELRRIMREEKDIVIGDGQQSLDGKIFRIGHMGWVTEKEIEEVVTAVAAVLPRCAGAAPK
jgi:aspartate aminotransferase-like enzyme